MSKRSQKALRNTAIIILSIVLAAFVIMFLTGRVADFIGYTGNTSASSAASTAEN